MSTTAKHRFQRGGRIYDQQCGLCNAVADADVQQMGDVERAAAAKAMPKHLRDSLDARLPPPAPDAEGEWREWKHEEHHGKHGIFEGNLLVAVVGECVSRPEYAAEYAAQIVSDHTLAASVPKLVEALGRRVSPTKCYCEVMPGAKCGECADRELLKSLGAQIQEKQ